MKLALKKQIVAGCDFLFCCCWNIHTIVTCCFHLKWRVILLWLVVVDYVVIFVVLLLCISFIYLFHTIRDKLFVINKSKEIFLTHTLNRRYKIFQIFFVQQQIHMFCLQERERVKESGEEPSKFIVTNDKIKKKFFFVIFN